MSDKVLNVLVSQMTESAVELVDYLRTVKAVGAVDECITQRYIDACVAFVSAGVAMEKHLKGGE